jgi:hypothetical protein
LTRHVGLLIAGDVMRPEDSDYYRARAIEERWLMKDAGESKVAEIHARLASEYDALANRLDLGDQFTDKLFQSTLRSIS